MTLEHLSVHLLWAKKLSFCVDYSTRKAKLGDNSFPFAETSAYIEVSFTNVTNIVCPLRRFS